MIDLVRRGRVRIGVAVGLQAAGVGNGTGACTACWRCAARRIALRARTCSGDGFDAAGRGRVTGASTVTGGRFDCCASAPENDATAIRPATADTFVPEPPSNLSSTRSTIAIERNDLGAIARPIPRAPIYSRFTSLMRFILP